MRVVHIACHTYTLALRRPLRLANETVVDRSGVLFVITGDNGIQAWGEAAPLPGFSEESLDQAITGGHVIARRISGKTTTESVELLEAEAGIPPSLHVAFYSALQGVDAKCGDLPLHRQLNPNAAETVPLCALLDGDAESVRAQVHAAVDRGYTTFKLKVGRQRPEDDALLVAEITGMIPESASLRLDANRAWTFSDALRFCARAPRDKVAYLEEPVQDCREIAMLQQQTGRACAVDETLQELSRCVHTDPERAASLRLAAEQAALLVWKPSLCLPLGYLKLESCAPVVLSAAYESGIGTAVVLACAAAATGPVMAAGVDTYARLAGDVLEQPLPVAGPVAVLQEIEGVRQRVDTSRLHCAWETGQ